MEFASPLQPARLLRRYKRFLADVQLPGEADPVTVHCPNTGSMRNLLFANGHVWLSASNNPKRKYRWTWEWLETPDGHKVCINTNRANALFAEALSEGHLPAPLRATAWRREVRLPDHGSRLDFCLDLPGQQCFVEIKSVTLQEDGDQGFFPDAVSKRGQRHLQTLTDLVKAGHRAALVFVVQHEGIASVAAAEHIDPQYARLLARARSAGVELYALRTHFSPQALVIGDSLPVTVSR